MVLETGVAESPISYVEKWRCSALMGQVVIGTRQTSDKTWNTEIKIYNLKIWGNLRHYSKTHKRKNRFVSPSLIIRKQIQEMLGVISLLQLEIVRENNMNPST